MKTLGQISAEAREQKQETGHEIFLVQLDRRELELAAAHAGVVYVAEFSRTSCAGAQVLTTEGAIPLHDWTLQMGARSCATAANAFLEERGAEGARVFANKLRRLLSLPEL